MCTYKRITGFNSAYPQGARQSEYEHLRFKQSLERIYSLIFQTALRVAANRQDVKKPTF